MSEPVTTSAQPAAPEQAAPAQPSAQAAPQQVEPQGTPPTPPALKRVNRLAQVREVMGRRPAEATATPASTPTEAPAPDAPAAPADKPDATPSEKPETSNDTGKAKAWADVMAREERARRERDAAKREREQLLRERAAFDAERKAQQEAAELLAKDPVAYAAKYGGTDFGKKLVDYTLDEKARFVDQQAAKLAELDQKFEQLTRAQQQREVQAQVDHYLAEHRAHWKADKDAAVLASWYDEQEIDTVVRGIANRHAEATSEVLTPKQLASNLTRELKSRLERLAQSEAGREFLKQFVPAAPLPAKPRPPAEAPKTLSRDLTIQGTPPDDGRLRKLSEKDRRRMIRDVLDRRPG